MSETPKPYMFDLWEHLQREHGLTLLDSELYEIARKAAPFMDNGSLLEEAREVLDDLLNCIAADELIPESVSYMQAARAVLGKLKALDTGDDKKQAQINEVKGHLALCVQMLESIADSAGVDLDGTNLTISVGDQSASLPIGKMLAKWKEITK